MPEPTDFPFVTGSGALGVSSDSYSASLSLPLEAGVDFSALPLADLDFEHVVVVLDVP